MILKKIKFHNFRPFIGDQTIDLSSEDKEKNVTVILGSNTFGKTTFVLSFIWCLYGDSRFSRPNEILNKKVEKEMGYGEQKTASVEIEFEDDGVYYTVIRSQMFTMGSNRTLTTNGSDVKMTYVEDSMTKSVGNLKHQVEEAIEAILPKDLSPFFFFEGEKGNEIPKADLGKSVRTLLGLEAFEKMREHIHGSGSNYNTDSVMGRYAAKISEKSGKDAKNALQNKKQAEEELQSTNTRIKEIENDIKDYSDKIEMINTELRNAEPTKALQEKRDSILAETQRLKESLNSSMKKFLTSFSKNSLPLLVSSFTEKARERLKEMDIADKGIKGIEAPAIYELLKRGTCLCGTQLNEGSIAYKNVKDYIDYIPPKNVGTLAAEMLENIDKFDECAKDYVEEFEELYKEIQKIKTRINDLEREEKRVLFEISRIGSIDTSNLESDLSSYNSRIKDLKEEKELKLIKIGSLQNRIENAEKDFNTAQSKNVSNEKFQTYFKYAESIYIWLNNNYNSKENTMRERLSKYINELYNEMYSGTRDVSIDKNYNIHMLYEGEESATTGLLKTIQYCAYVASLVKLSKEVMLERNNDDPLSDPQNKSEKYPLVFDAVFSTADEEHTPKIAKTLAESTEQLVFAVMRKDWTLAESGLIGKVGRFYELEKIDEWEVKIVEVNNG